MRTQGTPANWSAERVARTHVRKILHQMTANGDDLAQLKFRHRTVGRVPLVVLCDISGSMECYSRILTEQVDAVLPCRNLASLEGLAVGLSDGWPVLHPSQ